MKIWDILSMGLRNLLRRKTRTFLTIIGVVVGATAIVIMLSLGIGMDEQLNRTIESMGDLTIIDLQAWAYQRGEDNSYTESQNNLNEALLERIRTWDGVIAVSPYVRFWDVVLAAGRNYINENVNIIGIDASFIPYLKMEIEQGYSPQTGDTGFAIFGRRGRYLFRDSRKTMRQKDWDAFNNPDYEKPPKIDVLRESISIKGRSWQNQVYDEATGMWIDKSKFKQYKLDKIGILKYVENEWGYDENEWYVYVDYRMLLEIQKEVEKINKVKASESRVGKFDSIRIKTTDIRTAELIQKRLYEEEGIMMSSGSLSEYRDGLKETQRATQMLLGGIGAISLFVAAIGIANTMFMSIYERTKEIGVMKVLGCPLNGIQSMFLFEASIIGFCGGIFGVALSIAGSTAMNKVEFIRTALSSMGGTGDLMRYGPQIEQGDISVIPMWLILAAIIFSTVIGLVSGYLPARRATKISALEAIRNE